MASNPKLLFCGQFDSQGGRSYPTVETEVELRDLFAAFALGGILAYPGDSVTGSAHNNSKPPNVAAIAYEYADAMLAAREETP